METSNKKKKKLRVRGTATIDPATNEFGFTPFSDGPSSQTNVKNCKGGGKSWETTGSDPSRMITLKTKMSSPDQYSDVLAQFEALTRDLKPKKPVALPDNLRVVKEQGLECWLDETKNELTFSGTIDLSKNCRNWQAEVLRMVQLVVRRLPSNENFNRLINTLKKGEKYV